MHSTTLTTPRPIVTGRGTLQETNDLARLAHVRIAATAAVERAALEMGVALDTIDAAELVEVVLRTFADT